MTRTVAPKNHVSPTVDTYLSDLVKAAKSYGAKELSAKVHRLKLIPGWCAEVIVRETEECGCDKED